MDMRMVRRAHASSRPVRQILVLTFAAAAVSHVARSLVFTQFHPAAQARLASTARHAGSSAKFDMDLETDALEEEKTFLHLPSRHLKDVRSHVVLEELGVLRCAWLVELE
mmetsp:Transcript_1023/g.1253  ORF Transcript_1023/g.1253 Transcript_1023/m.1253 type:complete len:110 (+) Transcript_1023:77-406(+)